MGKVTKTGNVLRQVKRQSRIASVRSEPLILPNNSGDHRRSLKRDTPISDHDLVNKEYVDDQIAGASGDPGESIIIIDFYNYDSVTQGTWGASQVDLSCSNHYLSNHAAAADGDEIIYKVYFAKGTYTVSLMHQKYFKNGIVKLYYNTTLILTQDLYKALPPTWGNQSTDTFTVSTAGFADIKIKVDGKNAASSDYWANLARLTFIRTA